MSGILRHEGPAALFAGVQPAVIRQAVYGGLGLGLYVPVRRFIIGEGVEAKHAPLYKRIMAAGTTGGIGQLVAAPTDVLRVRLQADGRRVKQGLGRQYTGMFDCAQQLFRAEGVGGFYRGLSASLSRAVTINGCGIAAYDHTKQLTLRLVGRSDGLAARVVGALSSGLVSALVSLPLDVVKTRLISQGSGSSARYSGMFDCAIQTARSEGLLALYKGFLPTYFRLAPWQLVFFLTFEQINELVHGHGL